MYPDQIMKTVSSLAHGADDVDGHLAGDAAGDVAAIHGTGRETGHDPHTHPGPPPSSPPPRDVLESAGELLRALAAPIRIAIVLQLRESSRCVHELVDALEVPQPLVSQHLRILKAAGVVVGERAGREVHYQLVDHHLCDIVLAAVDHAGEAHP